ncbi:cobalamin-binding protein [Brumimicrobium salinarum]|uniref:Cobalamin-binding protein n=1 Tax=Brumimicrobium salinarum TaxID=2058658 RepID=A0A2I0R1Z4_9FLAO|nr:helical backbone metal receptor [Brumimicrobium salinarum]PKR80603.1 cobalamin-binding protein [Brumimicrobium salinarum]
MLIDQLGNTINIEKEPMRIVSLVPSQTELLYDLGLGEQVVGITKFCIHPEEWFRSKTRIGGTKDVDISKVADLNPDLIIGNKEENTKSDISALMEIAPVYVSDIYNLTDSLEMIAQVGRICQVENTAQDLIHRIKNSFEQLKPLRSQPKVAYLIWKDPYMGVGSNTFIDVVLTQHLGMVNVLGNQERYPSLDLDQLPETDFVFLSTEPYPFKQKHFQTVQEHFPHAKIMLVDGEYFSWYGSRLAHAPKYFESLLNQLRALGTY